MPTTIEDAFQALYHAPAGCGFDPTDTKPAAALAGMLSLGVPLNDAQRRSTWRKLQGYTDQLRALGVTELEPEPQAVPQPPPASAPAAPTQATVKVGVVGEGVKRRILTQTPFEFSDRMKRIPGAEFHKPQRCRTCAAGKPCQFLRVPGWHYPASHTAAAAIRDTVRGQSVASDAAYQALLAGADEAHQSRALRAAMSLDPIPHLKTTAWLHQCQAYWFAIRQDGVILDMDMGTGKSLTAVGLMAAKAKEAADAGRRFRALIMCPARVVGVWGKQFRIHAEQEWHVVDGRRKNRKGEHVLKPVKDRVADFEHALDECLCGKPHVAVVNYESIIKPPFEKWSLQQSWDVLVADEIHRLKSAQGSQSKHAAKLGAIAKFRVGLTGTLMPHSPMDVFAQMRVVDPGVFGTVEGRFKHTWMEMGGFQGKQVMGLAPGVEDEFARVVGDHTYHVGSDVLDLPDKLPEQQIPCNLSAEQWAVYRKLEDSMFADIAVQLEGGKTLEAAVTADNVLVKMLRLQQITGGAVVLDEEETEAEELELYRLIRDEASRIVQEEHPDWFTPAAALSEEDAEQLLVDDEEDDLVVGATRALLARDLQIKARIKTRRRQVMKRLAAERGVPMPSPTKRETLVFDEQPKAKLLADLLEDIDPSKPVIVFCKFKNDIDQVQKVVEKMGRRYAELSGRRADAINADAELADGVQVAAVQLQAGGTGINFTRSHHCVYYSLNHSYGDFAQSRKRLDRPGQTDSVRFYFLTAEGTIDEAIAAALEARESVAKHVGALIKARQEGK